MGDEDQQDRCGAALFVNLLSFWKKAYPALWHSIGICHDLFQS